MRGRPEGHSGVSTFITLDLLTVWILLRGSPDTLQE